MNPPPPVGWASSVSLNAGVRCADVCLNAGVRSAHHGSCAPCRCVRVCVCVHVCVRVLVSG